MRVVIDACVLFPTLLRELVVSFAAAGAFTPLWSARILEEWRRAASRLGPKDLMIAEAEIAVLKAHFPTSEVQVSPATEARLTLPDPDDVHVLAAALDGEAGELLTLNSKDFPARSLSMVGIIRRHPDEFLLELFHSDPEKFRQITETMLERAREHGIDTSNRRAILKRARLPRLAKALDQV